MQLVLCCGLRLHCTGLARAGKSYAIQVEGVRLNHNGQLVVAWDAAGRPANDAFEKRSALSIGASAGQTVGSTWRASRQSKEPGDPQGLSASVWYKLTAPRAGVLQLFVHGDGDEFQPYVAAFADASGIASLKAIATASTCPFYPGADVTEVGGGAPAGVACIAVGVAAGSTYAVQIDGRRGRRGTFTLKWTLGGACHPQRFQPLFASRSPGRRVCRVAVAHAMLMLRPRHLCAGFVAPFDSFSSRATLTGAAGTRTVSAVNASLEAGEPNAAHWQPNDYYTSPDTGRQCGSRGNRHVPARFLLSSARLQVRRARTVATVCCCSGSHLLAPSRRSCHWSRLRASHADWGRAASSFGATRPQSTRCGCC